MSERGLLVLSAIAFVLAVVALVVALAMRSARSTDTPCTWGASSIGPVTIVNGVVSGQTTPHVTGCR